jgi:hypothetical protein
MDLEQRVQRLERENRRLKVIGTLMLAAVSAVFRWDKLARNNCRFTA